MQINVRGKQIEVTQPIREYAESKVAKLPRYFDRVQEIDVFIGKYDQHQFEVEILIEAEHTDSFVVKVKGIDLYKCIDEAVSKGERQLTDHKEKLRNRKHNV